MVKIEPLLPKKKLLFKLWQFPHLSETFITAQIITAIKCDFEVWILVGEVLNFDESKQKNIIEKYGLAERIILEDFKIPKNRLKRLVKILLLMPRILLFFKPFLAYLKSQKTFSLGWFYRFYFYSRLKDFDIIHVQYGTNVHPIDTLKKVGLFNCKLVVSFHGHDAFFPINGFIENNGYYDDLFCSDNIIVANTAYLADKLNALGCPKSNLITIPVGIDTNFFRGNNIHFTGGELKLINVGRLDAVKGHNYAIDVVKKLQDRKKNVTLTIIGEGKERNRLEEQISLNKLDEYVQLVGAKSQEEVRKALLQHHVYIFCAVPLVDGRRETQGLATLEAQSCGLPSIVFDSGGVKYTVENNRSGFICDEYDVECVVEKIEFLIENPEVLNRMSKYSRNFVASNFERKHIDQKWFSLYSELKI